MSPFSLLSKHNMQVTVALIWLQYLLIHAFISNLSQKLLDAWLFNCFNRKAFLRRQIMHGSKPEMGPLLQPRVKRLRLWAAQYIRGKEMSGTLAKYTMIIWIVLFKKNLPNIPLEEDAYCNTYFKHKWPSRFTLIRVKIIKNHNTARLDQYMIITFGAK